MEDNIEINEEKEKEKKEQIEKDMQDWLKRQEEERDFYLEKFHYKVMEVKEPATLVSFNNKSIFMKGNIRVKAKDFILTDKELLIGDELKSFSLLNFFKDKGYDLWK